MDEADVEMLYLLSVSEIYVKLIPTISVVQFLSQKGECQEW